MTDRKLFNTNFSDILLLHLGTILEVHNVKMKVPQVSIESHFQRHLSPVKILMFYPKMWKHYRKKYIQA